MTEQTKYWVIKVNSWGTAFVKGTEKQAEEWRRHKANYERSVASKKEATKFEVAALEERNFVDLKDLMA